jgi:DNA repair protein RecN (Recombination protein N)
MLKQLTIEQFVIIDKICLDFKPGLTIFTGETGAGKSILMDALGLIFGDESNPELVRQGSEQSVIEAVFDPPKSNPVWKFLAEQGLVSEDQQEFPIRSLIRLEGPGERLINGKAVDFEFLKKLGMFLGEIHGQFANQTFLSPANQLALLDASGCFPPEVFSNVANALRDVLRLKKELDDENTFIARHRAQLPKIEDFVDQCNDIGMKRGFVEETKAEFARLMTAKETGLTFQAILSQLIAGNGALKSLRFANTILARQMNADKEKLEKLAQLLAAALENAGAAVDEMERLAPEYEIDTKPLHRLEEALETMKKLAEENRIELENLYELYEDMAGKLRRIRASREQIMRLNNQLIKAQDDYRYHAHILSEKRVIAAKALAIEVNAELAPLRLMNAKFDVIVEEKPQNPWTELGLDVVTFTARMNPGQMFSPVAETASGGELARLVLALKVVLTKVQPKGMTLIFDEIDTGIGGAAAAAVAERLAKLSDLTQLFVITHSPQVASRGGQHKYISKRTDGITTTSVVNDLSDDERIEEISRMLAGETITTESVAAAKSLISEARAGVEKRRQSQS